MRAARRSGGRFFFFFFWCERRPNGSIEGHDLSRAQSFACLTRAKDSLASERPFAPPTLTPHVPPPAGRVAAITGGCGYVGVRLALHLLSRGFRVRLLDVAPPHPEDAALLSAAAGTGPRLRVTLTSIADSGSVAVLRDAFSGCWAVFHLASYGMSGSSMLDGRRTWEVNWQGTRNVLAVSRAAGVPRLVYTSSYNAGFAGQPVEGGSEARTPSALPWEHTDEYSRTKALAEALVLQANGTTTCGRRAESGCAEDGEARPGADGAAGVAGAGGGPDAGTNDGRSSAPFAPAVLYTCAIRTAGIYGPGERRHLPRTLRSANAALGMPVARVGAPSAKQDYIHVDDLAKAHLLAAEKLLAEGPWEAGLAAPASTPFGAAPPVAPSPATSLPRPGVAAGQFYYVSDNDPINTLTFFEPLLNAFGLRLTAWHVPVAPAYAFGYANEVVCRAANLVVALLNALVIAVQERVGSARGSTETSRADRGAAPDSATVVAADSRSSSAASPPPLPSRRAPFPLAEPFLTRTEVLKTAVMHWFSVQKAVDELGFVPRNKTSLVDCGAVDVLLASGLKQQLERERKRRVRLLAVLAVVLFAWIVTKIA